MMLLNFVEGRNVNESTLENMMIDIKIKASMNSCRGRKSRREKVSHGSMLHVYKVVPTTFGPSEISQMDRLTVVVDGGVTTARAEP